MKIFCRTEGSDGNPWLILSRPWEDYLPRRWAASCCTPAKCDPQIITILSLAAEEISRRLRGKPVSFLIDNLMITGLLSALVTRIHHDYISGLWMYNAWMEIEVENRGWFSLGNIISVTGRKEDNPFEQITTFLRELLGPSK